jgi:hypothetical protein
MIGPSLQSSQRRCSTSVMLSTSKRTASNLCCSGGYFGRSEFDYVSALYVSSVTRRAPQRVIVSTQDDPMTVCYARFDGQLIDEDLMVHGMKMMPYFTLSPVMEVCTLARP